MFYSTTFAYFHFSFLEIIPALKKIFMKWIWIMMGAQCLSFDSNIVSFILSAAKHDRWMKFLYAFLNLYRRRKAGNSYVGIVSAYS